MARSGSAGVAVSDDPWTAPWSLSGRPRTPGSTVSAQGAGSAWVGGDDEHARADHATVASCGSSSEPRPHMPTVLPGTKVVMTPVKRPPRGELQSRPRWPGAEYLLLSAVELDVVIASPPNGRPEQHRRLGQACCAQRCDEPAARPDNDAARRLIPRRIGCLERVLIADAVAHPPVPERGTAAPIHDARRLAVQSWPPHDLEPCGRGDVRHRPDQNRE